MLIEQTLDKLNAMKLGAMADAFQQQLQTDEAAALGFEERLGLLVDAEWTAREQRKLQRRLHTAKLRYPASLEAVDFTHPRRLNRQQVLTLGTCAWIAERHNLVLTGPCGIGKSFLACAFVERACRRGFTARYLRMPRLLHELAVGRGDGSYARLLARLAKLDLLAIDDWMLAPLRDTERRDLTEVIEDRAERASTLIAQPVAGDRLARRHRRPQPGRRHLRPPAPRRAPRRVEGPLDAADARRASQRPEGDDMSIPSATPAPVTLSPGVAEPNGGFARGERQRPAGRGPRAREHRLQARLAQLPTPLVPTVAACAKRAFRGTRVVARRNALDGSSSTKPPGPARPFRLARVPWPGMTNTDVRLGTHPGNRIRKGPRCARRQFLDLSTWRSRVGSQGSVTTPKGGN